MILDLLYILVCFKMMNGFLFVLCLDDKIRNESFIGIFKTVMNELGYDNIMVIGYRGFYTSMKNGSGVRIGNRLVNATVDIDCKQVEFKIHSDGKVEIPRKWNFKLLPCKYASNAA